MGYVPLVSEADSTTEELLANEGRAPLAEPAASAAAASGALAPLEEEAQSDTDDSHCCTRSVW